jgi:hypothetical protein
MRNYSRSERSTGRKQKMPSSAVICRARSSLKGGAGRKRAAYIYDSGANDGGGGSGKDKLRETTKKRRRSADGEKKT